MAATWGALTVRGVATALLVLGVAGGAYVGQEGHRQQAQAQARAHAIEIDGQRQVALAGERADRHRREAQAEAAELAKAEARQARRLVDQAEEAAEQRALNLPTGVGPIPASCAAYTGNRATGCTLMLDHGFGIDQMPCLDSLWTHESGWNHQAGNPVSGAFGIPQSLPGNKMAAFGDDWETNPVTQILWGLSYIQGRYGNPCGAWSYFQNNGFY